MFDGLGTGYQSGSFPAMGNFVLDLGVGNAQVLGSYAMKDGQYNGNAAYEVGQWTLAGSNDNSTYTTLDTQAGVTFTASQVKTFAVTNTTAYRYYRVTMATDYSPSQYEYGIGELYLYANTFTSGNAGDFYYETSNGQWWGPRPSGGSPVWPAGAGPLNANGVQNFTGIVSTGTKFTASGCSNSTLVGGATAGSYKSGTSGACTVVITPGITAPNGWACAAYDLTTTTDVQAQTGSTVATATIAGTTVSGDIVSFHCIGY
jgi:hypothetical protein